MDTVEAQSKLRHIIAICDEQGPLILDNKAREQYYVANQKYAFNIYFSVIYRRDPFGDQAYKQMWKHFCKEYRQVSCRMFCQYLLCILDQPDRKVQLEDILVKDHTTIWIL